MASCKWPRLAAIGWQAGSVLGTFGLDEDVEERSRAETYRVLYMYVLVVCFSPPYKVKFVGYWYKGTWLPTFPRGQALGICDNYSYS